MAPKRTHEGDQDASARSKKKQKTTDARVIHFQSGPSSSTAVTTNSEWLVAFSYPDPIGKLGAAGLPSAIDVEKFTEVFSSQPWCQT
jgi:hypothetical protein